MPVSHDNPDKTALLTCYWLNWGLVCDPCYSNSDFRLQVENPDHYPNIPPTARLKLLQKFQKGEPLKDLLKEKAGAHIMFLCKKCGTMNMIDTVLTDPRQIDPRQQCQFCGNIGDYQPNNILTQDGN